MRNLPSKHSMSVIVYACLISCFVEAIVDTLNGSSDGLPNADIMDNWETILKPRISKRSTSNMVDIAMFEDSSQPGKTFSIYVDDTITRLIIQVEVEGSNPVIMITKPSGIPGPYPGLNTTTGTRTHVGTIDTAVKAADYGIWKIMKMDASKWSVKVQGESPLDFSHQFLEGTMFKMPITGDPIQGKTYTTQITVPEIAKIQKIDMVMIFVMEKFTPANMLFPKDKGNGTFELASVKMLNQEFMIGIQGKDKSGHFFRRVALIKPVTLSLLVPSYSGVKLYENTEFDITFYVVNKLSTDQEIDVRIEDTKKFAQAPIFISATLTRGQNYTGKFVIKGGHPGETTVATITARQYLGHGNFSLGPSEVRQFTVERNDKSTTSATTIATTTTKITTTKSSTTSAAIPKSTTSNSSQVTASTSAASYIVSPSSVSSSVKLASSVALSPKTGLVSSDATTSTTTTTTKITTTKSSTTSAAIPKSTTSNSSQVTASTSAASYIVSPSSVSSLVKLASSVALSPKTGLVSSDATTSTTTTTTKITTTKSSTTSAAIPKSTTSNSSQVIASTSAAPYIVSPSFVSSSVKLASSVALSPKTGSVLLDANKATTTTTEENSDSFKKREVFTAAIASGVASGALIGVAALVTIALLLKKGMKAKTSVAPEKEKKKRIFSEDDPKWAMPRKCRYANNKLTNSNDK